MQMWAGQSYPLCDDKACADIIAEVIGDAKSILTG